MPRRMHLHRAVEHLKRLLLVFWCIPAVLFVMIARAIDLAHDKDALN